MKVDDSVRTIVKIIDALSVAWHASCSPLLPLFACEIVQYSLKNGVCQGMHATR